MARSAGMLRVGRYFVALFALIIFLYLVVFWPGQRNTPKLGLDLRGGAQAVFQAQTTDGGKAPSKSSLDEARQIISRRVNGLGVSNAEVVTEGGDRIQVSVPGARADSQEFQNISKAAVLNFRPEILDPIAATSAATSVSPSASPGASGSVKSPAAPATAAPATAAPATAAPAPTESAKGDGTPLAAAASATPAGASPAGKSAASATPAVASPAPGGATATTPAAVSPAATQPVASPTTPAKLPATVSIKPVGVSPTVDQWANLGFAPPADAAAYGALTPAKQAAVQAELSAWPCDGKTQPKDDVTKPLVACSADNSAKYLLGTVIVQGKEVQSASASAPGSQPTQTEWLVLLSLKTTGQAQWADYTAKHNAQVASGAVANVVAYVLDSTVDTPPSTIQETITGQTQISGGFTQDQAQGLANQLKFGSLPLRFNTLTSTTVSATLGSDQLRAGLLAGGIGLVLVVIYSLFYYRALGLVTIASLLVSGGLTYAMLVILGSQIGFTLTLAGIAGFIVAVGITADSFVVFFERIKDEVHEGRSARVAVPRAWQRSRRTIISADTVSLLAAVVLYYFAAGDVRGFAFTLGMSTVLDLVVVFLFTHPLVSLLSRSERFGSTRFSGLDSVRKPNRFGYQPVGIPLELPDDHNPDALLVGAPSQGTTATAVGAAAGRAASPRDTAPQAASSPRAGATAVGSKVSAPAAGLTAAERAAARRGTSAKTLDDNARSGEDDA